MISQPGMYKKRGEEMIKQQLSLESPAYLEPKSTSSKPPVIDIRTKQQKQQQQNKLFWSDQHNDYPSSPRLILVNTQDTLNKQHSRHNLIRTKSTDVELIRPNNYNSNYIINQDDYPNPYLTCNNNDFSYINKNNDNNNNYSNVSFIDHNSPATEIMLMMPSYRHKNHRNPILSILGIYLD